MVKLARDFVKNAQNRAEQSRTEQLAHDFVNNHILKLERFCVPGHVAAFWFTQARNAREASKSAKITKTAKIRQNCQNRQNPPKSPKPPKSAKIAKTAKIRQNDI